MGRISDIVSVSSHSIVPGVGTDHAKACVDRTCQLDLVEDQIGLDTCICEASSNHLNLISSTNWGEGTVRSEESIVSQHESSIPGVGIGLTIPLGDSHVNYVE